MLRRVFHSGLFLLVANPERFWRSHSDTGRKTIHRWLLAYFLLTAAGVLLGIAGRFLYSLSNPELIDYLPEAISGLVTPVALLILLTAATRLFISKKSSGKSSRSFMLSIASLIPYLIVSAVILLIRDLYFMGLLGFYSAYVYSWGLRVFFDVSAKKAGWLSLAALFLLVFFYVSTDLLCRYLIVTFVFDA